MFQGDFQSSTRRAATIVKETILAEISRIALRQQGEWPEAKSYPSETPSSVDSS